MELCAICGISAQDRATLKAVECLKCYEVERCDMLHGD